MEIKKLYIKLTEKQVEDLNVTLGISDTCNYLAITLTDEIIRGLSGKDPDGDLVAYAAPSPGGGGTVIG